MGGGWSWRTDLALGFPMHTSERYLFRRESMTTMTTNTDISPETVVDTR